MSQGEWNERVFRGADMSPDIHLVDHVGLEFTPEVVSHQLVPDLGS